MGRVIPHLLAVIPLCLLALPAGALNRDDLDRQGYRTLSCTFKERCVIGQPCEVAWSDAEWMFDDASASAYRVERDGGIGHKLLLMLDARWKDRSQARAILSPMREAVASHLTVFDGGTAVFALQYAGAAGSGQMLRGRCDFGEAPE